MVYYSLKRWILKFAVRRRSSGCSLIVFFMTLISFIYMTVILILSYEERPLYLSEENAYQNVRQASDIENIQQLIASQGDLKDHEERNSNLGANQAKRRKFIFVLRHYEQLGMCVNNLLTLLSAAKFKERRVVVPYVNNSRFSGLPQGAGHGLVTGADDKFAPFNFYFDLPEVNRKLVDNSYSTLASLGDFRTHCTNRFNVVVHFLYDDKTTSKKSLQWFDLSKDELRTIKRKARKNNGWVTCPFIKRTRIGRRLDMKVSRYVCVDPEVITSLEVLEKRVLNGSFCVGIIHWKGNGTGRTHFPLHHNIKHRLVPSDLKHNPLLIKLAEEFVKKHFHGPFISVHVRAERHLLWKGFETCLSCIMKLARLVKEWQGKYPFLQKIFVATDLVDYGSDILLQEASPSDRRLARNYLTQSLDSPVTLTPPSGLYDRGALAIIEMNILASGKLLFTVGDGNFQEWVMDLFLERNKNVNRIRRLCILK